MQKVLTLDRFCQIVLRQVPEADLNAVRQYVVTYIACPYFLSSAYQCARNIEDHLIRKGGI